LLDTKAFSMLELVFVIVIIGILATIAIPRLWVTRDDAIITKARTQVASIRSSIINAYSQNILSGVNECPELEAGDDNYVFENILKPYPIKSNQVEINWTLENNSSTETNYSVKINNLSTLFIYEKDPDKRCPFVCDENDELCKKLTE